MVTPCSASPATSSGSSWPLTSVLSSSWRIIPFLISLRRLARIRPRRTDRRVGTRRQAVESQIRIDGRVAAGKGAVHLGIIERVAARENHVAEALAIGARQAAIRLKPGKGVLSEHARPGIGIIARRIAAAPDVREIARAIARRHVDDVEPALGERTPLELFDCS